MNYLKLAVKLGGVIGAIYGGYELGESIANGRAVEVAKMLGNEIQQLKELVLQQSVNAKDTIDTIQITVLGLVGAIAIALVIGMIVWIIKSTKGCIANSVESAVDAKP